MVMTVMITSNSTHQDILRTLVSSEKHWFFFRGKSCFGSSLDPDLSSVGTTLLHTPWSYPDVLADMLGAQTLSFSQ